MHSAPHTSEALAPRAPLLPVFLAVTAVALPGSVVLTLAIGADLAGPGPGSSTLIWLTALLSPVGHGIHAAATAALTWALLVVLGIQLPSRALADAALRAEVALAALPWLLLAIITLAGGSLDAETLASLPLGLSAFASEGSALRVALARSGTVLHALWAGALAAIVIRRHDVPLRHGLLVVGTVAWVFVLGSWIQTLLFLPPTP